MAMQRDVSIATVLQAYSVLENRGLLEARPQSGYYVRPKLLAQIPEPRMARPMARPAYVGDNDLAAAIVAQSEDPEFLPLGAACPDPTLFPNRKLARILGAVCATTPRSSAAMR
jgi:DNA-binding transcriptional MocR family regulator